MKNVIFFILIIGGILVPMKSMAELVQNKEFLRSDCCVCGIGIWIAPSYSYPEEGPNSFESMSEHKTYEGPFPAFGLSKKNGWAKYQYLENYDGTRLFDGDFEYHAKGLEVKGQFKKDFQVGQWIFRGDSNTTIINFNHNGQIDGNFVLYTYVDNTFWSEDGELKGGVRIMGPRVTGKAVNGYISQIDFVSSKGNRVHLTYDENKECTRAQVEGNLNIEWNKYSGWRKVDSRTGDYVFVDIGKYGESYPSPNEILIDTTIGLNNYLMRSSKRE